MNRKMRYIRARMGFWVHLSWCTALVFALLVSSIPSAFAYGMTSSQLQQAASQLSPSQQARIARMMGRSGTGTGGSGLGQSPEQSMVSQQSLSADELTALAQPPAPLPTSRIEQDFDRRLRKVMSASFRRRTLAGALKAGEDSSSFQQGGTGSQSSQQGGTGSQSSQQGGAGSQSSQQGGAGSQSSQQGGGSSSGSLASIKLDQFGYDLFSGSSNLNMFFPATDIPVPAQYVLGPGDEIQIQYFGSRNDNLVLVIDRDGLVDLPNVGSIALAGLSFRSAKALLAERISRKLSDVTASITMGRLRSIRVFVLGGVRHPGSYLVSGISTISHALFVAGGISKYGSLRHVQLKRDGRVVRELDLYKLLLNGDNSRDARLLPGDVVFVPPIGRTVAVAGDVVRPGIFELNHETTVGDVLRLAGGLLSSADTMLAQIDRIGPHGNSRRIDLRVNAKGRRLKVLGNDLIVIHTVPSVSHGDVTLTGAVKRPGLYGYAPGMMLSDVIHSADDLLPSAYTKQVEITRYTVEDGSKRIARHFQVNLGSMLSGDRAADVPLMPYDVVMVRQLTDWQEHQEVTLSGEVRFPGTYAIRDGEHLSSVLARAGGFTKKAYLQAAVFTRRSIRKQQQKQIDGMAQRLQLEIAQQQGALSVSASSNSSSDQQAALDAAKRVLIQMEQAKATGRLVIHLTDIEKLKGSDFDLTLRNGDTLYVPQKPDEVMVIGQVYNTTAMLYQKHLSRDDYIARAGGPTDMADTSHIYVVRANGMVDSYDGWHKKPIGPGDVIVVPEKLSIFNPVSAALDWSKVLYQIGVAMASMKVIGIL